MDKQPLLRAQGICKSFPGVKALDNVDIACYPGEIVGLIGENGAGKSTLMKILSGVYSKDSGAVYIDGVEKAAKNPAAAQKYGIAMVYQDTLLAGDLTVSQNIFIGHELLRKGGFLDLKGMERKGLELISTFGVEIDPKSLVKELTIAQKQLVEIAKALSHPTKLLILDEPTSALSPSEANKLFEVLKGIKEQGICVLFISHRLPEVLAVCDRIIVMRDGCVTGEVERDSADEKLLIKMMVGREPDKFFGRVENKPETTGKLLEVKELGVKGSFADASFHVNAGEIVGMFGIAGNGQREIMRALAGLLPPSQGEILVGGIRAVVDSPQSAMKAGISCLTDERRTEGLFQPLSISENISLYNLKKTSSMGIMQKQTEKSNSDVSIAKFDIKCVDERQKVMELSGGNQQKVIFSANHLKKPKVYLFCEPTVGIDVASKEQIYTFIRELAASGAAIVVLSSDIVEVICLSDRILTVSMGKITADIPGDEATEESVMNNAMSGGLTQKHKAAGNERKKSGLSRFIARQSNIIVVVFIILVLAFLGISRSDFFFTPYNLGNILLQMSPLAIIALGQSMVIMSGGIDLSVGGVVSMTTAIASYWIVGDNFVLGIIGCVFIGLLAGMLNGLLITKLKMPDIIVTLATLTGINGIALLIRPTAGGRIAQALNSFVNIRIFGELPMITIFTIIIFVVFALLLRYTKRGTYIYAVGSNRDAAYGAGIQVDRIKILVYSLSGVLTALGGLIQTGRIMTGDPRIGAAFTMKSVTAVVVGGIVITGGRGSVIGALLGALMILLMENILNMLRVSAYYQYVWIGVILLAAVGLDKLPQWAQARRIVRKTQT